MDGPLIQTQVRQNGQPVSVYPTNNDYRVRPPPSSLLLLSSPQRLTPSLNETSLSFSSPLLLPPPAALASARCSLPPPLRSLLSLTLFFFEFLECEANTVGAASRAQSNLVSSLRERWTDFIWDFRRLVEYNPRVVHEAKCNIIRWSPLSL